MSDVITVLFTFLAHLIGYLQVILARTTFVCLLNLSTCNFALPTPNFRSIRVRVSFRAILLCLIVKRVLVVINKVTKSFLIENRRM